jgi:Tol biopolymer transport system component
MRRALQAPVEPSPRQGPWRERVAWVGALVLAVAATLVVGTNLPRTPQTEQVFRYNIYAPPQTVFAGATFTTLSVPAFAVSPDGRNIVFAAGPQSNRPTLWVKGMDELSARPLDGTEGAENPFWAPDSRSIAFFSQGKLRTVAAIGGLVRNIADAPDPRGGSWSPNGVILFGTGTGPVFRVPESGGAKPVEVTSLNSSRREGSHRWPVFLPDGLHFLLNVRSGLAEDRGVFAGTLDGAAPIPLVRTDSAALHANGYLLFLTENTLQAQRFDLKSLELSGPAYVVAEGVGRSSTTSIAASVSNNGVLAYSGVLPSPPGRLTWVDRTGAIGNSVGPESVYADFRLSHDEKRLLASQVSVKTGVIDIHMTDLTQNRTQPFASGPFISASPLWSPDDNRVVFRTTRNGGLIDFYQKSSAGGGKYELLLAGDAATSAGTTSRNLLPLDWSTDHLLFSVNSSVGSQLWLLPTREKGKPVLYLESPSQVMHANLSPDGSLLAYTSNESGRFEVWVETVPRSDRKEQVSAAGGYEPQWNADGSELYYLSLDRKLMAVRVGANASFSDLRVLFQTGVPENIHAYHMHYLPSRDGRFLMNLQVAAPPPTPITIVHNWVQGLKE